MIYRLSFPDTPPSLNRVAGHGSHWPWTRAKKAWQEDIAYALVLNKIPRNAKTVGAVATMRFATTHKRDEGNFRALLEKCLGDALVNGGWLPDDTPEHYVFGEVTFLPKADDAKPETTIIMEVER